VGQNLEERETDLAMPVETENTSEAAKFAPNPVKVTPKARKTIGCSVTRIKVSFCVFFALIKIVSCTFNAKLVVRGLVRNFSFVDCFTKSVYRSSVGFCSYRNKCRLKFKRMIRFFKINGSDELNCISIP